MLLIGRTAWKFAPANQKQLPSQGSDEVIRMEFLRSFLRRHFAGKQVVVPPNVGCFLRLYWTAITAE